MTTRDAVLTAMSHALRGLNDSLEEGGWDQPPSLWAVRRVFDDDVFTLLFEPCLEPEVFTRGHASDVLALVAEAAEQVRLPVGDGVFAFAFASEAWMVESSDPGADGHAGARTLHRHPERVEVRMISAVDLAGFHYGVNYTRTTGKYIEHASRRGEGEVQLGGYVYESLQRLVDATL